MAWISMLPSLIRRSSEPATPLLQGCWVSTPTISPPFPTGSQPPRYCPSSRRETPARWRRREPCVGACFWTPGFLDRSKGTTSRILTRMSAHATPSWIHCSSPQTAPRDQERVRLCRSVDMESGPSQLCRVTPAQTESREHCSSGRTRRPEKSCCGRSGGRWRRNGRRGGSGCRSAAGSAVGAVLNGSTSSRMQRWRRGRLMRTWNPVCS